MANKVYPKFKKGLLQGVPSPAPVNLLTQNVKIVLIDLADYTYSDSHEFLSDIPSGARVALSPNLAGKTLSNLADFDSNDPIFTGPTGDQLEALAMYIDTGVAGTSKLVFFQDTGISGMPLTPDGNDVKITVNASGWFRL
jgi:hypothetical protein